MSFSDFHVHTTFSDGQNSPEEMVLAAIRKGMPAIGFSDHSYTSFDTSYCIQRKRLKVYWDTIATLKEKYKEKIKIYCGIEQDLFADHPADEYDYAIGSVHYVKSGEKWICVDDSAEGQKEAVEQCFGGDFYRFAEAYYENVVALAERTDVQIVGHFDLITKFNEGGKLFDEADPRYVKAWQSAADKLLEKKLPFEINTGVISRGYRSVPYPAMPIIDYIRARGGSFVLSSDCHSVQSLCYEFEKWETLLK